MELNIAIPNNPTVDLIEHQKMSFIFNALTAGWTIKKIEDKYIFTKKHEGKKEVYLETYLRKFIESNFKS